MPRDASELAHRLAREAEAVCRHYLSNGRREGRYWLVGDVAQHAGPFHVRPARGTGSPARAPPANGPTPPPASTAICSTSSARAAALLDFHDVADEARRFLSLPRSDPEPRAESRTIAGARRDRRKRRGGSSPCRSRSHGLSWKRICAIAALRLCTKPAALRFHPRCYYRPDEDAPTETWPAMIARVTDLDGRITGAHRTWLDPSGTRQGADRHAATRDGRPPRQRAVRFGVANDVLAAGEGIETMLSLRCVLPTLPMAAALSANHLAAMLLPLTLRRLYIARDADAAGDAAVTALTERAEAAGIEAIAWSPRLGDFNEDLAHLRH